MNSIHRVGVAFASLATLTVLAGVFAVQGYMTAQAAAAAQTALTAEAPASPTAEPTVNPTETLAPKVIYVNPIPTPEVIQATQPPRPRPAKAKPAPVVPVAPTSPGGDDGGSDD